MTCQPVDVESAHEHSFILRQLTHSHPLTKPVLLLAYPEESFYATQVPRSRRNLGAANRGPQLSETSERPPLEAT